MKNGFVNMAKFRSHQELEVYQLAFESAMIIFEISKQFPKEEKYALTIRYVVRHVRYVPILQKLFESDNMLLPLLLKYMMPKRKPPKHKFGSIFHYNVVT